MVSLMSMIKELESFSESFDNRKERELYVCSVMLTEDELSELSSVSTGYSIARDRVIENVIKYKYPKWYEEITSSSKRMPIFGIEDLADEFKAETQNT